MTGKPDGWLRGVMPALPVVKTEAKPAKQVKADEPGDGERYRVTGDDLDAMHQRQAERVREDQMRGELAVAHLLGQAPSLVAALQKLKSEGRT